MQASEKHLPETEQRLQASQNLHTMTISQITSLMIAEEHQVITALENCQKHLDLLIEEVVQCFGKGGRLFYVGAGTSGRLGVLDASECPPTFRAPQDMVQGIIAGGDIALQKAVEGAEDSEEQGGVAVAERQAGAEDIVVGIAASGRTPFVHGALKEAKRRGARTGLVTCITLEKPSYVTHLVCAVVGAEILSGSTRLKAGTATKLILNMITTVSMVRLGKVYENLMVDLHASNIKLRQRAKRIFMQIVKNSDEDYAANVLEKANWEVKTAVVMALCDFSYENAQQALQNNNNTLHLVLENNG